MVDNKQEFLSPELRAIIYAIFAGPDRSTLR